MPIGGKSCVYVLEWLCITIGADVVLAPQANYAHQQELDMIPLMMQKDYQPKGWREYQPGALRACCW